MNAFGGDDVCALELCLVLLFAWQLGALLVDLREWRRLRAERARERVQEGRWER